MQHQLASALILTALCSFNAHAEPFSFSTGNPDFKIATGAQPASAGKLEVESADDFILSQTTQLNHATFTGLLTGDAGLSDIKSVAVEIYRVFSKDSVNPPSGHVPTRVNSPSDVAFDTRESANGGLSFSASILQTAVTAANSVLNDINPIPNQKTGGEGQVFGTEVIFNIDFNSPFSLAADHYFFVPQVETGLGNFLWLSAAKPIVGGTGPFAGDLQSWIRDQNLAPDWLRIGTDIVGGPAINHAFSLNGVTNVSEPATGLLFIASAIGFLGVKLRKS